MTERPVRLCRRTTSSTFSARLAGKRGGHFVKQQDVGLDRQRARQIEDAQDGERNVARRVADIEIGHAEFAHPVRGRAPSACG